jgi:hypothetical protein
VVLLDQADRLNRANLVVVLGLRVSVLMPACYLQSPVGVDYTFIPPGAVGMLYVEVSGG